MHTKISIHPMLRFIKEAPHYDWQGKHFNTSHVTVYQEDREKLFMNQKFQYIPCYGLSRHDGGIVEIDANFNTSHVTVYRAMAEDTPRLVFHFNTSHVTVYLHNIHLIKILNNNFNTSHVTVYLVYSVIVFSTDKHFNTSHVTVYQGIETILMIFMPISIHPMLRFI